MQTVFDVYFLGFNFNSSINSTMKILSVRVYSMMAEKVEYVIKTKFGQAFDFVFIDENELSFENFIKNGEYDNNII